MKQHVELSSYTINHSFTQPATLRDSAAAALLVLFLWERMFANFSWLLLNQFADSFLIVAL